MRDHLDNYSKSMMSRVMSVSRSGFNKWLKGSDSVRTQRKHYYTEKVLETYETFDAIYGAPRIKQELNDAGLPCSETLWLRSWRSTAYAHAMAKASSTLGIVCR